MKAFALLALLSATLTHAAALPRRESDTDQADDAWNHVFFRKRLQVMRFRSETCQAGTKMGKTVPKPPSQTSLC